MPADTSAALRSRVERITAEGAMTLAPAVRGVGLKVAPSTAYRWATTGVALPDGTRLTLEAFRLGGKLYTSSARVLAFVEAQQRQPAAAPAPPVRTPHARNRASDRAERQLIAAGC